MILIEHCELCHKKAVAAIDRHSYCKEHYIQTKETVYLNNHNDLGILRWMKDMMPEHFSSNFATFHEDNVQQYLQLYDPIYTNRHQRQLGLINYREAGKSHLFTLGVAGYIGCHNNQKIILPNNKEALIDEGLMVIASETGDMAEEFVVRLRDELQISEQLRYFYGGKIQDAYDSITGQWTRRAFKFNRMYYLGVGTGMQIRGRIKGKSRPTTIIFDDIYDEDTVRTPEARKKVKIWFYGKALNSLDSVKGKAMLSGTIVHDDTVLVECENNDQWKMMKYYPMPLEKFKELVDKHMDVDYDLNRCRLPFHDIENEEERLVKQKQYFDNLQNTQNWGLTWPERHPLLYFATKFKDAVQSRQIELMYQEYFHVTMSEAQKKFKPEYFQRIKNWEVFKEFGLVWFRCAELYDQPQHINIEFGIDLAGIGGTDNAVILPVGALPDRRIIVFPAIFGKMHLRDGMYNDDPKHFRISKVIVDTGEIMSKGIIDETFRLALRYYPSMIKVGQAGEEDLITPQFAQLFLKNNNFIPVVPRKQKSNEGSKHKRIMDTCLPVYQTRMAYHCQPSTQVELELENLTKYPLDDVADALECAVYNIRYADPIRYETFTNITRPRKMGRYNPDYNKVGNIDINDYFNLN